MLSAMQVKRALRRGDQIMMVQLPELKMDSQMPGDKKLADLLKEYEDGHLQVGATSWAAS
jgi:hypothetical protein